jgi:DNA polymerase-3 subunit delta'
MNLFGHNKQREFFQNVVKGGGLSHAYIFSGPEGVGKKLFAKELARGLLCDEGRLFEPCACPSCRQVEAAAHPDYYLFEAKEELKIDSVREVAEIAGTTSYSGKWKAIIFDNAHILCTAGADAANALLKTLEEPGQDTVFFLISHRLERILPTILSRCLNIVFEPLSADELYHVLDALGGSKEGAPYAEGSVSAALLMADMDIHAFKAALDKGDRDRVGRIIFTLSDKEKLRAAIGYMASYFTGRYKQAGRSDTVVLIQYLAQISRELDYNVNINLALLALFTKLAEYYEGL